MKVKVILNALLILHCLFLNANSTNMINSQIEVDTDSLTDDNKIQGTMNINGQVYKAICDCNQITPEAILGQPALEKESGPTCDPSKLKINQERQGTGASFNEIRRLIGNIEELNYVKVPHTSFKCLDGRHNKPGLGVPGGDAGEFILALSVYEDLLGGRQLTQDNVNLFLSEYLKHMSHNSFYMCTDDAAIAHIEKELQIEGLNIVNPRNQIREELLPLLIKPENVGDLHIRMMIKHPEQFSIRKEIVEMFIKSYYRILWNKKNDLSGKLYLDILSGDHTESAFVEVRSENACQNLQLAPLIPSKDKGISVFVNHLDAVSIRREHLAEFFTNKINHHQDPIDVKKMHNRLNHHGYIGLEITGAYIAKNLPFDTINLA